MQKCCLVGLALLATVSFGVARSHAALTINLDFSGFATGAPANGSAILGGANLSDAQTVIEAAADYWEAAFANSSSSIAWSTNSGGTLTQNISVGWGAQGGSTLASGGTGWFTSDGRWSSGSLTWDNDGSSAFYVDTNPTNSSEWNQSSERDLTFNSVDVNAERVFFDAPAGTARNNADMLSVAIHEIGHALGYISTFPAFLAADLGSDSDIDITTGPFSGAQIGSSGGHTNFVILSPNEQFPYDPGGGGYFPQFNYGPNVMSPAIVTGTRKLLTEADIAIAAQFLQFDMSTVNFDPGLSTLAGDANLDGTVNALDLSIVATNWLAVVADGVTDGDFNTDGTVNALDLSVLASNWLATADGGDVTFEEALAPNTLGSIPEPASLAMLFGGAGLLILRRSAR